MLGSIEQTYNPLQITPYHRIGGGINRRSLFYLSNIFSTKSLNFVKSICNPFASGFMLYFINNHSGVFKEYPFFLEPQR